jgi:hypothetical protein
MVERLEDRVLLAANVIVAPAAYEFRDMGFDAQTGEVGIVGYVVADNNKTATLFELNPDHDAFVTQSLVGLGPDTQVFGIASDASRIAGVSKSSGSIDIGEGTTWLRSSPAIPEGIGYVAGACASTSVALDAWSDGVVGYCGGGARAIEWTPTGGIVDLGGSTGVATAFDVSANGNIQVGFSSHEVFNGVAYYWDDAGIHKLEDPFDLDGIAYAVSPNGNWIGGYVGEIDELDNPFVNAAVWDSNRDLVLLKDSAGDRFEGRVLDVSNLGYAVGETLDGRGFIWHPSFDGVQSPFNGAQIFDDWLAAIPSGTTLPFASKGVEAIAEDRAAGQLLFALSDYEQPGASAFIEVDVAGVAMRLDYGDAPSAAQSGFAGSYPVTLADNGARHVAGSLRLGAAIDDEADGLPSTLADGDGGDDDGVTVLANLVALATADTGSSLRVVASAAGGVDAWIDFNRDGDWSDAGEQIATNFRVAAGATTIPITVSAGASAGTTFLRVRLSSLGSLPPTGPASDGEVEDYRVEIEDGTDGVAIQTQSLAGDLLLKSAGGRLVVEQVGTTILSLPAGAVKSLDITGNGASTLRLDLAAVQTAVGASGTLRVRHDQADRVEYGSGWKVELPRLVDGVFLQTLTQAGATVLVQNPTAFQNPLRPLDTDGSGSISPLDVLLIINELNRPDGRRELTVPTNLDGVTSFVFFDTSGDNSITPLDVLLVINFLNAASGAGGGGAEGESPAADRCLVSPSADVAMPFPLSKRNRRDVLDEVFAFDADLWW